MSTTEIRTGSSAAPAGKAQEQKLEVALRQFVRGALQGIIGRVPNTRNFHTMLAQIDNLSSTDPARARWYRALADCTSLIAAAPSDGPISQLMDPIWEFEIEQAPPETIKAFCSLSVSLVTTNLRFAEPCLRMWVSQILRSCGLDTSPDVEPLAAAEVDQMQEMAHGMLQRIVQLIPQTTTLLLRILVFEFPQHASSSASTLLMYVKNLLRVSEYCPSLRDPLLTTIVERLMRMDLEILETPSLRLMGEEEEEEKKQQQQQQEEEEEEEEGQNTVFQMDEAEDTTSTSAESAATAVSADDSKQELVEKLDSLLVLMFEYLDLVRRSDSELCDSVFACLLRIFDRSILRTHGSRFTQYLLFVSCGFEHRYATSFARCLLAFILDSTQEAGLRVGAAAYLSGFLSHARFLRVGLVTEIFDRLLQWAQIIHPRLQEQMSRRDRSVEIGKAIQANTRRSLAALDHHPRTSSTSSGGNRRLQRRPFPSNDRGPRAVSPSSSGGGQESLAREEVHSQAVFCGVVQCLLVVLSQRLPEVLRHYGSDAGDSLIPQFALIGRSQDRSDSLGSFEAEEDEEEDEDSRSMAAPLWTGSPALSALPQPAGIPSSFSLGGAQSGDPLSEFSPSLQPSRPNRSSSVAAMLSTAPDGSSEDATLYPQSLLEEVFLRQCRIQDLLRPSGALEPLEHCCGRVQRDTAHVLRQVGLFSRILPHTWQERWSSPQFRTALHTEDPTQCNCPPSKARFCFFPFDPYRLPHSSRYVKGLYRAHQTSHNIRVVDPRMGFGGEGDEEQGGGGRGVHDSSFAIPLPPRASFHSSTSRRPQRHKTHQFLLGAVDDDGESSDADDESLGNGMVMAHSLYD